MFSVRTILHPTDFSQAAELAFRLACSLARDYGARLIIVHSGTQPTIPPIGGAGPADPETYERGLREQLGQLQRDAGPIQTEVRLAMRRSAADRILETAREVGADLIVAGTHGRTGVGRALLGSVAEQLVRKASCPVLTVRSPHDHREPRS